MLLAHRKKLKTPELVHEVGNRNELIAAIAMASSEPCQVILRRQGKEPIIYRFPKTISEARVAEIQAKIRALPASLFR